MGRGLVSSNLGDGWYRVRRIDVKERVEFLLARLSKARDALSAILAETSDEIEQAQLEFQKARTAFDEVVDTYDGTGNPPAGYSEKLTELFTAKTALGQLQAVADEYRSRIASIALRQKELRGMLPTQDIYLWSADASYDLAGEVGLIDTPKGTVIFPDRYNQGASGASGFSGERDGVRYPALLPTPEAQSWNFCMEPGWQKFLPLYRTGTLTAVSLGTAGVLLDGVVTTDAIRVVASEEIEAAFRYMTCDGAVFQEGDKVIVYYPARTEGSAQVIGFLGNPRPCVPRYAVIEVSAYWIFSQETDRWYTVWDMQENKLATITHPVSGEPIQLPCREEYLQPWLGTRWQAPADPVWIVGPSSWQRTLTEETESLGGETTSYTATYQTTVNGQVFTDTIEASSTYHEYASPDYHEWLSESSQGLQHLDAHQVMGGSFKMTWRQESSPRGGYSVHETTESRYYSSQDPLAGSWFEDVEIVTPLGPFPPYQLTASELILLQNDYSYNFRTSYREAMDLQGAPRSFGGVASAEFAGRRVQIVAAGLSIEKLTRREFNEAGSDTATLDSHTWLGVIGCCGDHPEQSDPTTQPRNAGFEAAVLAMLELARNDQIAAENIEPLEGLWGELNIRLTA